MFDKIAANNFSLKIILYFCFAIGQLYEPALCHVYRHTFVRCS